VRLLRGLTSIDIEPLARRPDGAGWNTIATVSPATKRILKKSAFHQGAASSADTGKLLLPSHWDFRYERAAAEWCERGHRRPVRHGRP